MEKILIIGTTPTSSGIGGVTIHVQRLLDYLEENNFSFTFIDYRKQSIFYILKAISHSFIIHIHISNVYFQLALILYCKLLHKKSILTIHGNIGKNGWIKNRIVLLSLMYCCTPITLNRDSYEIAKCVNGNSTMIPAFIPPVKKEILQSDINDSINKFKSKGYSKLYATNAYSVVFDANNQEVYGISDLLTMFYCLPQYGLIFSDPSSSYSNWLKKQNISIPNNVLIINKQHSFFELIKLVDTVIRNTSTDGDSLTIKEALYLGKTVLCTNCVPRPNGCLKYSFGDTKSLKLLLEYPKHKDKNDKVETVENGADKILKLYKNLLD